MNEPALGPSQAYKNLLLRAQDLRPPPSPTPNSRAPQIVGTVFPMSGDTSAWVAAIAACVAAGVVIWQSIETRRSANASKVAAQVAAQGLTVATDALAVAKSEEGHSRELVAEAYRARLDASLPDITVHAGGSIPDRWFWRSQDGGATWSEAERMGKWHLDSDANELLGVVGQAFIGNGSTKRVDVSVVMHTAVGTKIPSEPFTVSVEPGKTRKVQYMAWTSVRAWAGISIGEPGEISQGNVAGPLVLVYSDPTDCGVDRTWVAKISGSPIFESAIDVGVWKHWDLFNPDLYSPGSLPPALPQQQAPSEARTYWLSRSRQVQIGKS